MTWNVLGHEWAAQLLKQHMIRNAVRHAYLFTGPEGVGRRTLALRFAQALNCLYPPVPGDPCGTCQICQQTGRMEMADLSIVQSEPDSHTIKIEQVRDLQHTLSLAPYQARYRVAVLLRFEEATAAAQNALLKTLEEPPQKVVLLLTADAAENLLPTIVSRCEVLRLRPLAIEQLAEALQTDWEISNDEARKLAHLANGRPGYALFL
ncbi:MAG: DNA polymerase III subunit delta', partial [Anaerolineales bacterium]